MKYFAALAVLILATTTAHAMSAMTNATGPYNYSCDEFAKATRRERALALAFAQGYFAALNMHVHGDRQVNLQERWRELNAYILRKCTDKSNPYLYRRFVGDFIEEALDEMMEPTFTLPMTGTWCRLNSEGGVTPFGRAGNFTCPASYMELEKNGSKDEQAHGCQAVTSQQDQDGLLVTARCYHGVSQAHNSQDQDFLFTLRDGKLVISGPR